MTFSHIGNGLYTCLAADTKVTTGMTTNSILIEVDTGTLYVFASGSWGAVSGGGGGGAPTTVSYVTLGTNATLTSERVLTAGTDISLTDAGAGSTVTVDIGTNVITTSNTKTLTNKTIAAGSNTITGIADANITAHTTSKITTSSKSLLNSAIVYNDQTQTFGAFDQIFPSTRLKIKDATTPANYIIATSAIAADRTVTLPLLTGNDTLVTAAFTQTLTNKTLDTATNTITGLVDANTGTFTTTKITTSSKSLLNSAIVYNDQSNTFGAFDQTIPSTRLKLSNSGFAATLTVGTLGGNVTITLPSTTSTLVTSTDSRLTDARTPTTHATTHNSGGSDVVSIDTIDAGTDITTNNASTTKHGLLKKLSNSSTEYMSGTGVWSTPAGTGGSGATDLEGLSDVDLTSPAQYEVLQYGAGTDFVNALITNNNIASGAAIAKSKLASLNIGDADTATFTTTKISTLSKSLLSTSIVYVDQINTFDDFNQIFKDNRLLISNPADTFAYTLIADAIAANRNITLPLLTANDTMVTAAFTQTLTNKTIAAGSNTITGIVDANIGTHTSTKITITAKGQLNSSTVYTDQTNTYGAFAQVFPTSQLKIQNPAGTFNYILATSAIITADKTVTLPLLTGNDVFVTEAFAQTLTNKTIAAGSNTVTGIVDANIGAHTTTKITTTAKGQLNSSIVYTDQANALGDFNFTFKDNRLLINNPADTFAYTMIAAAIAANRSITLPLLTGNDTMVTEAFTQTLTNKTLDAANNTVSNIVDTNIGTHTTTKISTTSKSLLNSSIAYTDAAITLGDFNFTLKDNRLLINNPADTFNYTIIAAAIAANRTITLPLLTGNDVMVTEAFAQTLTNKTLAAGSNTITGLVDTNISAHTTSKITTTSKSLLNTAIVYNDTDNVLGAHYFDLTKMTAPSNPGSANDLRLYVDTADTHLKHRNSAGTVTDITAAAGGGSGAPTTAQYVALATDATLTNERVLTAGTNITVTDAGAGSTVTVDIGTNVLTTSNTKTLTNKTIDAETNTMQNTIVMPSARKTGVTFPSGSAGNITHQWLATSTTDVGTITNVWDSAEGVVAQCPTGTSSNSNGGQIQATSGMGCGRRSSFGDIRLKTRCGIDSTSNSRLYAGYSSNTTFPKSDTPLATTDSGVVVGFRTTDANFSVFRNDGGGSAMTVVSLGVAKDTAYHSIEIIYHGTSSVDVIFDGSLTNYTTVLPSTSANQYYNVVAQNSTTTSKTLNFCYMEVEGL